MFFITLSRNTEVNKRNTVNSQNKTENTLPNNQKSRLEYYSSKYKNYSTSLYIYDSLNNQNSNTLSHSLFFQRLCQVFHLDQSNISQINVYKQNNGVDCCYRIMYYIYMLGLCPNADPFTDYYEDKKFKLFTELQCVLLNLCLPRLSKEEAFEYINTLEFE